MEIVGIIAEYNPFHNGHAAQLAALRSLGARRIVVCMSGDVVQRGSFAVLPPALRARLAVEAGADLVLSLPNPYACKSAEGFAEAGVALLSAFGCDTLAFGAETPGADFCRAAQTLLGGDYRVALKKHLAQGAPFAVARAAAAGECDPALAGLLATANNNLGVEYCKAIRTSSSSLLPLALPRVEAQHGDATPTPGSTMASATFLRGLWGREGAQALAPYVSPDALALYQQAQGDGLVPNPQAVEIAILSRLRSQTWEQLAEVRGMGEGLEHRLYRAVQEATSLNGLYAAVKTRRYAHARIRRLVLDAALGYTQAVNIPPKPPYLHVLAARRDALALCQNAVLPISTSLSRLAQTGQEGATVAAAHAAAADLAALCRENPARAGLSYTQKPFLL